jgi:ubiquitin carboxyl-terminal hydrolase 4/11/15
MTEICRFPKYLIVQLVRFTSGFSDEWWANKIKDEVTFPVASLDLGRAFPNFIAEESPPIYDLLSVVNHKGGVGGGHYWVRKEEEKKKTNFLIFFFSRLL